MGNFPAGSHSISLTGLFENDLADVNMLIWAQTADVDRASDLGLHEKKKGATVYCPSVLYILGAAMNEMQVEKDVFTGGYIIAPALSVGKSINFPLNYFYWSPLSWPDIVSNWVDIIS